MLLKPYCFKGRTRQQLQLQLALDFLRLGDAWNGVELATGRNSEERKGKEAIMMLSLPTEAGSNFFSSLFGDEQSLFSLKVLFAATDMKKAK